MEYLVQNSGEVPKKISIKILEKVDENPTMNPSMDMIIKM